MNTNEIMRILNRNSITSPYFIGCFSSDNIPCNVNRYPYCMIVNMDPSWLNGSHWIAIYCQSVNNVEYYDPLGFWPPLNVFIRNYLASFKSLRYNNFQIQSSNSNACGMHAIYFLYHRCAGLKFTEIIKCFQLNVIRKIKPDSVVKKFFEHEIFNKI